MLRPREVIVVAEGSPGFTMVFSTVTFAQGSDSAVPRDTQNTVVALVGVRGGTAVVQGMPTTGEITTF